MTKRSNFRLAIVLCGIVLTAACQSASPTAPTDQDTLTGTWSGTFTGNLIVSDAVSAELTDTDSQVTGRWSMPMPATLVAFGAPADINLAGPVTGTVTGTAAELAFEFEGFPQYFPPGCAIAVSVSSFNATTMDGTWTTNESCQAPAVDDGTMTMTRQ